MIEWLARPSLGVSAAALALHPFPIQTDSSMHCVSAWGDVGGGGGRGRGEGMYGGHPSVVTGRGHLDPVLPGPVQSLLTVSTLYADHHDTAG